MCILCIECGHYGADNCIEKKLWALVPQQLGPCLLFSSKMLSFFLKKNQPPQNSPSPNLKPGCPYPTPPAPQLYPILALTAAIQFCLCRISVCLLRRNAPCPNSTKIDKGQRPAVTNEHARISHYTCYPLCHAKVTGHPCGSLRAKGSNASSVVKEVESINGNHLLCHCGTETSILTAVYRESDESEESEELAGQYTARSTHMSVQHMVFWQCTLSKAGLLSRR